MYHRPTPILNLSSPNCHLQTSTTGRIPDKSPHSICIPYSQLVFLRIAVSKPLQLVKYYQLNPPAPNLHNLPKSRAITSPILRKYAAVPPPIANSFPLAFTRSLCRCLWTGSYLGDFNKKGKSDLCIRKPCSATCLDDRHLLSPPVSYFQFLTPKRYNHMECILIDVGEFCPIYYLLFTFPVSHGTFLPSESQRTRDNNNDEQRHGNKG
jgi:hypothetical protein